MLSEKELFPEVQTSLCCPRKEMVVEQNTNFYASNLELGTIPPGFVHQLGRSRWVIDTEVFQTITTDGHLKNHPCIRAAARH